jgi:GAF domain-containing protein
VDLGLVQDSGQLTALMARAATVLEAKGLVLWVSESDGGVLRPTIAHGYSDRVLQRMGTLSTSGDNVTSLAFRTRQPQVVRGSIDGQGALAVPLVTAGGCVGVLAAEVQGAKPGDARFAIARIIAAQLSTLVAPAVSAETRRTAAQS